MVKDEAADSCSSLIAKLLKRLQIKRVFGVVGIPVTPISFALAEQGISFYGCRSEQAAGFAACGDSYLNFGESASPGILLTTGGPGFINALSGLGHATVNKIPLVLISGSAPINEVGKGAFQELNQVNLARYDRSICKASFACQSIEDVAMNIVKAFIIAVQNTPGGVYVDLPADIITADTTQICAAKFIDKALIHFEAFTPFLKQACLSLEADTINRFKSILEKSEAPLLVLGNEAAIFQPEHELLEFVDSFNIPVITIPMARGLLPDDHSCSIFAARSRALSETDLAILAGAPLDWMLHFGEPSKWRKDVRFILMSTEPQLNDKTCLSLKGNVKDILGELNRKLKNMSMNEKAKKWINSILEESTRKKQATFTDVALVATACEYISYKEALRAARIAIDDWLKCNKKERTVTIVAEGSNTLDISRVEIPVYRPRGRLDAGVWGTMGVGLAYCLAAYLREPDSDHLIVAFEGDSAIGFSLCELETLSRFNAKALILVFNNGGVYTGVSSSDFPLPTQLNQDMQFDKVMQSVGGRGYTARTLQELQAALEVCLKGAEKELTLINIIIDPLDHLQTGGIVSKSKMTQSRH